ncbi:hypothetical protein B296_00050710 [Ensete ventricosum]|uniref:Uncharacterized protein n=1 Tax=Ensete ventricosum TaxID=4639 RepID=A0A426YJW9_ENSVE|nr:hypothetical protein B296_00050710 [Ensete ventricosum]
MCSRGPRIGGGHVSRNDRVMVGAAKSLIIEGCRHRGGDRNTSGELMMCRNASSATFQCLTRPRYLVPPPRAGVLAVSSQRATDQTNRLSRVGCPQPSVAATDYTGCLDVTRGIRHVTRTGRVGILLARGRKKGLGLAVGAGPEGIRGGWTSDQGEWVPTVAVPELEPTSSCALGLAKRDPLP